MSGRAKRYSNERKLNLKKVFAVLIFIVVIVMFVIGIKKLVTTGISSTGKISTRNYFPLYSNNAWGIVDSNGEIVIKPEYQEMPIVPDSSQPVFVITYDVEYTSGSYKTKVVNAKNEPIITGYDDVQYFDFLNNKKSKVLNSILKVKKDNLYGIVDLKGNKILEIEYEKIDILADVENSLLIVKDGKKGISDYAGTIVVEPIYKEIYSIGEDYKNGYITVNDAGLYGITGFDKTIIFDNQFLDVKPIYSSNKYAVKIDHGYRVIDKTGKVILDRVFEDILEFSDDNIVFGDKGKYGITDIYLVGKVDAKYEMLKSINSTYYIAKSNGLYGIINSNDELQIDFKYISIEYKNTQGIIVAKTKDDKYDLYDTNMSLKLSVDSLEILEDYMKVSNGEKFLYYNFKFEEKNSKEILKSNSLYIKEENSKYGFENENGKEIVECKYDKVTEFNKFGFAGVKTNGVWGVINIKGEIIATPSYNLDNYSNIDFVGKYHLGIGADYYTDM